MSGVVIFPASEPIAMPDWLIRGVISCGIQVFEEAGDRDAADLMRSHGFEREPCLDLNEWDLAVAKRAALVWEMELLDFFCRDLPWRTGGLNFVPACISALIEEAKNLINRG